MELLKVDSIERAFEKLAAAVSGWPLQVIETPIFKARDKILSDDVYTKCDIPGFCRSTVDGYAVRAKDTAAASDSIPVFLKLIGQIEMGCEAKQNLAPGQCMEIPTGGMIPHGSDAVVMVEYTEPFGADGVSVNQSVSIGENMVRQGEDAQAGNLLLPRGKCLGSQEIGALAAAGIVQVPVFAPLKLAIISTGDELVPPDTVPELGQVRDINTHTLTALAEKNGFEVVRSTVLRDDDSLIEAEIRGVIDACDVIVISGGSSQGKKDVTREVIDRVASPGVFTHGLAVKPGKPTILGVDSESRTLFAGLPGHPVSAMMIFELLLCRLWRHMTGTQQAPPVTAELSMNIASSPGKTTCWPAKLRLAEDGYLAEPVFGKSGLITVLTKADGYFVTDRNVEGLPSGSKVYVHLF